MPLAGCIVRYITPLQYLVVSVEKVVQSFTFSTYHQLQIYRLGHLCPSVRYNFVPGLHFPQIIPSTIGFVPPYKKFSLTNHVGPVLTKLPDPLPCDLLEWLNNKGERAVVYISMGSHIHVSKEFIGIFVDHIPNTNYNYSAIWVLRYREILDDLGIDTERFFITSWVPQLSVLSHRAVGVAVLHRRANGVHKTLYI